MIHQCLECQKVRKKWEDCPGVLKWYPPSVIGFCPNQTAWLREHLCLLEDNKWPVDPTTSYYNIDWSKHFKKPYLEPKDIATEINYRLKLCGDDGLIAKYVSIFVETERNMIIEEGTTYTVINGRLPNHLKRLDIETMQIRIERVVKYISGWQRRKPSYQEFIRKRRSDG